MHVEQNPLTSSLAADQPEVNSISTDPHAMASANEYAIPAEQQDLQVHPWGRPACICPMRRDL